MSREKAAEDNKKVKVKGGRLSLFIGVLLFILGLGVAAMPFLGAPALAGVEAFIGTYLGLMGECLSAGILLVVLSVIILTSRRGRPFNYIFVPLAIVTWYSLMALIHLATGNMEPGLLMDHIDSTKGSLLVVLLVLEVLAALVIGLINSSLNSVWRRHKEKKAQRNVRKEVKASRKEKRKQASQEEAAAEEQPADVALPIAEPKLSRKEKKAAAKAAGKAAKEGSLEVKAEKSTTREGTLHVQAEAEARVTLDPDSPLSFPKTVKIPEFTTIPRREPRKVGAVVEEAPSASEPVPSKEEATPTAQEEYGLNSGNVVNISVLANSARKISQEEEERKRRESHPDNSKRLFRKGGMLESALEAAQMEHKEGQNLNNGPIIGYEDKRNKPSQKKADASFAPSNLSPDHPRYKLFESLQRKNNPEPADVTHFPSRGFTPADEVPPAGQPSISIKEPVQAAAVARTNASPAPVPPEDRPAPAPEPIKEAPATRPAGPVHEAPAVETPAPGPSPVQAEAVIRPATPKRMMPGTVIKPAEVMGEEEDLLADEAAEAGDSQIEFKVGIGGLRSNDGGEGAIIARQRRSYIPPSTDILTDFPASSYTVGEEEEAVGHMIESVMHDFRVEVSLADIVKGPTVTLYEYTLAPGVLVSKVENLEKNIALRIGGQHIRILAPVPGKSAVGIEVPNAKRVTVGFKELLPAVQDVKMNVPMILGRDIQGTARTLDVSKTPHLLIAGTTGSGKSVCINCLIASILYTKSPKEVRLIMVDPKVVELSLYNGIPHLLTPVITEPKKVLKMLAWLVEEMERRYRVFNQIGARNIENFNARSHELGYATEKMPYIVLIMDEFADLMTVIGKDIEDYIRRIMAKARAAGIHVVMATQRPSSEVVTGTIKNNIPTRIAFTASSAVNSRIILDEGGAENLLGRGDMLLSTQTSIGLERIQGAFLSDDEVEQIVRYVKTQGEPDYLDDSIFEDEPEPEPSSDFEESVDSDADLYEQAKQICFERHGASASYLQRRLSIGYNRAARLVEQMEDEGIVGPANGSKPREILRYE